MLNRVTLLLNVVVLVVNFLLALSATDSQVGIMESTSRIAYGSRFPGGRGRFDHDAAMAFLHVAQSIESYAPHTVRDRLDARRLTTVQDAIHAYYASIARGMAAVFGQPGGPQRLQQLIREVSESARLEVQQTLEAEFTDPAFVKRLTTEIIRQCR